MCLFNVISFTTNKFHVCTFHCIFGTRVGKNFKHNQDIQILNEIFYIIRIIQDLFLYRDKRKMLNYINRIFTGFYNLLRYY